MAQPGTYLNIAWMCLQSCKTGLQPIVIPKFGQQFILSAARPLCVWYAPPLDCNRDYQDAYSTKPQYDCNQVRHTDLMHQHF